MKFTSSDIEKAMVCGEYAPFSFFKYTVIPNLNSIVSHECDLLALTKANYAHEIEIKISKADLLKDFKKDHKHRHKKIKYLWYAGPKKLLDDFLKYCPETAGIYVVGDNGVPEMVRKAVPNTLAIPFNEKDRTKLLELGTLRYWTRFYKVSQSTIEENNTIKIESHEEDVDKNSQSS